MERMKEALWQSLRMSSKKHPLRYKNQLFLKTLGAHCRKLRVQKGYSIDRLSKEGDQLSPGAIHRLERGQADVHISLLYRYADVLEIPVSQLLKFEIPVENDKKHSLLPFHENKKQPPNTVPYYPIEIAAGLFGLDSSSLEPEGWIEVSRKINSKDYFAAHIYGNSMEPTIPEGSLCLFKKYSGGSRNGQIMLVQAKGLKDPEMGYRFVIKRYQRITPLNENQTREHVIIHLLSDNPKFAPIILKNLSEEDISTPAQFVQVLE
jgi:phage repressor protein C with HTH and peptisase S24 domain